MQLRLQDIKTVMQVNPFKFEKLNLDRGERGLTPSQILQRDWATDVIESGRYWDDHRTHALIPLLQRMQYDDALVCGQWRLEWLYINSGYPHFRLYWKGRVYGVADIHADKADVYSSRKMPFVRHMMAAFLVLCGWHQGCIERRPGQARTRYTANMDHQYRLFKIRLKKKRRRSHDLLDDREQEIAWKTMKSG